MVNSALKTVARCESKIVLKRIDLIKFFRLLQHPGSCHFGIYGIPRDYQWCVC